MTAQTVLGYHGTSKATAKRIAIEGFLGSANVYDWLGHGVYFWEEGPVRAHEWAVREHGDDACVVCAEITLLDCLNLGDLGTRLLKPFYQRYVERFGEEHVRQFRQRDDGPHEFDCAVINFALAELEEEGALFRVVRCPFAEGDRLFEKLGLPSSAIREDSHVQLCVRDLSLIGPASIVELEGV